MLPPPKTARRRGETVRFRLQKGRRTPILSQVLPRFGRDAAARGTLRAPCGPLRPRGETHEPGLCRGRQQVRLEAEIA